MYIRKHRKKDKLKIKTIDLFINCTECIFLVHPSGLSFISLESIHLTLKTSHLENRLKLKMKKT